MKKLALLFLVVFSFSIYAQSILLDENFNYGATSDTSLVALTANWVRHSGAMGPAYNLAGLSYNFYPLSGVGGAVSFTNGGSGVNDGDIHQLLSTPVTTDMDVYIFFLVNLTSANTTPDYFLHVSPAPIGTTFRGRVFARNNAPGWSLGLSKSSDTRTDDNTVLNFGQTYLAALKYTYNTTTTSDDVVTLYLYETGIPGTEPGSPLVTIGPVGSGTTSDPTNIGSIAIRQGSNTPTGFVDGIRIATSFSFIPVELTSFTVSAIGSSVNLKWSTASETNNSGFEIERKSSSSSWNKIGFVSGNGTTTEKSDYSFIDKNLSAGKISYRLKQIDYDGTVEYSKAIEVDIQAITKYSLEQNYPNPFNPGTKISFSLPQSSFVTLKVYNLLGQEIATLVNEIKSAGSHTTDFDASKLNSGIYIYKLEANSFTQIRKMTLIK